MSCFSMQLPANNSHFHHTIHSQRNLNFTQALLYNVQLDNKGDGCALTQTLQVLIQWLLSIVYLQTNQNQ